MGKSLMFNFYGLSKNHFFSKNNPLSSRKEENSPSLSPMKQQRTQPKNQLRKDENPKTMSSFRKSSKTGVYPYTRTFPSLYLYNASLYFSHSVSLTFSYQNCDFMQHNRSSFFVLYKLAQNAHLCRKTIPN